MQISNKNFFFIMPRPSKRKSIYRERDSNGRWKKLCHDLFVGEEEWGDDDDSGWEGEIDMQNELSIFETLTKKPLDKLIWTKDAHLEKHKRGSYLTGKTKKSTFYDKYGPSGSFTLAAKGTAKITQFMQSDANPASPPDDFLEVLDDMDDEEKDQQFDIQEKLEILRKELCEQKKNVSVVNYNKKRAIFEYLNNLDSNGKGKIKASEIASQLVYIDALPYRARTIRNWATYWLENNHLPFNHQGRHQKIIRLIDDEDTAEKCWTWVRSQGGTTTPLKFKNFIEEKLLVDTGISKKKTITLRTAERWLNVLGYSYQSQKQGNFNLYC
jgi:hypothetical protein